LLGSSHVARDIGDDVAARRRVEHVARRVGDRVGETADEAATTGVAAQFCPAAVGEFDVGLTAVR